MFISQGIFSYTNKEELNGTKEINYANMGGTDPSKPIKNCQPNKPSNNLDIKNHQIMPGTSKKMSNDKLLPVSFNSEASEMASPCNNLR